MDARLDTSLDRCVMTFRDALSELLADKLTGLYLHGSIALGDYDERNSDIDFLCILDRPMSIPEIQQLQNWHEEQAVEYEYHSRLDGEYILHADVGKVPADIAPYPAVCSGRFRASTHWDINAVTWWILKTKGIAVHGPQVGQLAIPTTWLDVERAMEYNLRGYWPRRLLRPETFDTVGDCLDAVLTMCRIINTLENKTIESKCTSADMVQALLQDKWQTLVQEAVGLRRTGVTLKVPAVEAMRDHTQEFIRYTIDLCKRRYLSGR